MPGATGRDVHIDVPLSNVVIAYRPEGFIADQLFPIVPVPKQSDGYFVYDTADAFRREKSLRAPGVEANVITRRMSSDTFFANNYALKDRIPYEDINNADAGFLFTERSARGEFLKDKLMLDMEYRVANMVTSGSNCGSYSAVASAWTDGTNADPIANINTAINNVQDYTGIRPNSVVFGLYAWRLFREHAGVINRVYGTAGTDTKGRIITRQQAADLFEVERLLVGGAYYNTAGEGQTQSLSKMWNDNVLTYYAPMQPKKDKPSFGYSFRWNKLGHDMQARIFQLERADAEEVQVGYYQDEKRTGASLSFLIRGVGSSQ